MVKGWSLCLHVDVFHWIPAHSRNHWLYLPSCSHVRFQNCFKLNVFYFFSMFFATTRDIAECYMEVADVGK